MSTAMLHNRELYVYTPLSLILWLDVFPQSAGAGVAVSSIMMFVSDFIYIEEHGVHAGCYVGDLSELCHKCVTHNACPVEI
jgi:hypothetical protein